MNEGPEKLPDIPPMSAKTGNRLMIVLALTSAFLGLLGLGLEHATERWLSQKLGTYPFFLSTPIGLSATLLTILTALRIKPSQAIVPAVMTLAFWVLYLLLV